MPSQLWSYTSRVLTTYHNYFWSALEGLPTYRRIGKSESLNCHLNQTCCKSSFSLVCGDLFLIVKTGLAVTTHRPGPSNKIHVFYNFEDQWGKIYCFIQIKVNRVCPVCNNSAALKNTIPKSISDQSSSSTKIIRLIVNSGKTVSVTLQRN